MENIKSTGKKKRIFALLKDLSDKLPNDPAIVQLKNELDEEDHIAENLKELRIYTPDDERKDEDEAIVRLFQFLENAQLQIDEDLNIISVNEKASKLLGQSNTRLVDTSFPNIVSKEYRELIESKLKILKETGNPQYFRTQFVTALKKVLNAFVEITYHKHNPDLFTCNIIDFNELLNAFFVDFNENDPLYKLDQGGEQSPKYELDELGKFVRVNQAFEKVFGYGKDELKGMEFINFVHPEDQERIAKEHHSLLKKNNLSINNYRIKDKAGNWFTYNNTGFLSENREGTKSMTIISDRISKIIKTNEELEKIRHYQTMIFENLPDIDVYLFDKDLNFLFTRGNEKFKYGLSQDDITGRNVRKLFDAGIREQLIPVYKKTIKGKSIEKEIKMADQVFYVTTRPIKDREGNITAGISIAQNITHDKTIEQELKKAKKEAEASDRAKSLFLATMSHEIRTPLNTIIGFTSQLFKSDLNKEQEKFLEHIKTSSEHLLNVVNELLIIFKIEMGKVYIDDKPFSIPTVMKDVYDILEQNARNKKLELDYFVHDEVPETLIGDPFRLKQVLINLVGNAVKYTDEGCVHFSCKVKKIKKKRVTLHFSVQDSGIGIPQQELPFIFDEFKQAENIRKRKRSGTGLGLTITKKLIDLQGGKIKVKSKPGKGTVFNLTISYKIPKIQAFNRENKSYQMSDNHLKGMNILIVDDDEQNLLLTENLFKEWEVNYQLTHDAEKALQLSKEQTFDAILLDIHMPGMTGTELLRKIRNDENNPNATTLIIAITANALQSEHKKYMIKGFDDSLIKPISENDLYNKLCNLMDLELNSEENYTDGENNTHSFKLDLTELNKTAKGDESFREKMIRSFFQNTQKSFDRLRNGLDTKDHKEIGEVAHKMASSFRYFSLDSIVEQLRKVENIALHNPDPEQLYPLTRELIMHISQLLDQLRKEYDLNSD